MLLCVYQDISECVSQCVFIPNANALIPQSSLIDNVDLTDIQIHNIAHMSALLLFTHFEQFNYASISDFAKTSKKGRKDSKASQT